VKREKKKGVVVSHLKRKEGRETASLSCKGGNLKSSKKGGEGRGGPESLVKKKGRKKEGEKVTHWQLRGSEHQIDLERGARGEKRGVQRWQEEGGHI